MRVDARPARPPAWAHPVLKTTTMRAVRVVGRDDALASLRQPAWQQALAVLPGNPLPDAVVVTLADGETCRAARTGWPRWKQWDQVDLVQLDSAWVQRLEAILRFARIGLGFLAACVAVVVLATVFNTAHAGAVATRGNRRGAAGRRHRILRAPSLPVPGRPVGRAGLAAPSAWRRWPCRR